MSIIGIVAVDDNWGIGKNGKIPWSCSDDMRFFRETTLDSIVVMGRRTYESLPGKLDRRTNIYLSRCQTQDPKGVLRLSSIEEVWQYDIYKNPERKPIYIIGGAEIYKLAAPMVNCWIVTYIKGNYNCDTFFPIDEIDIDEFEASVVISDNERFSRVIYTRD